MTELRRIASMPPKSLARLTRASTDGPRPELIWINPTDIYVEAEYQRNLSEGSIRMIRKIVAGWRWSHIKPVICARVDGKLMAIDGQHTAIAAATLKVDAIPAMIVEAKTVQDRAAAFIGQNCDRLQLTAAHLYYAALAAGEANAVAVGEACRKARVAILRFSKGGAVFQVGETFAVTILRTLVKRHGVAYTAKVLRILVDAKRAPIPAIEIMAVDLLMRPPFAGGFDPFNLVTAIRSQSVDHWLAAAAARRAKVGGSRKVALAEVLCAAAKRAAA